MPQHSLIIGNYNNSFFESDILLSFNQKNKVNFILKNLKMKDIQIQQKILNLIEKLKLI